MPTQHPPLQLDHWSYLFHFNLSILFFFNGTSPSPHWIDVYYSHRHRWLSEILYSLWISEMVCFIAFIYNWLEFKANYVEDNVELCR